MEINRRDVSLCASQRHVWLVCLVYTKRYTDYFHLVSQSNLFEDIEANYNTIQEKAKYVVPLYHFNANALYGKKFGCLFMTTCLIRLHSFIVYNLKVWHDSISCNYRSHQKPKRIKRLCSSHIKTRCMNVVENRIRKHWYDSYSHNEIR